VIRLLALAGALLFTALPTATAAPCTVDDASLTWGFKESFRSYISGTIANGEWTVADGATYTTPDFGFSGGSGTLSQGKGAISFPGSIEFTGHGGILDTTVANPQLRFDGSDTAMLLLDVSGTTQEGAPIDAKGVEFATVDVSGLAVDGVTEAKTVLTEAGAAAFGTYEAGTALDPVTVEFAAASECMPLRSNGPTVVLVAVGVGFAALVALLVAGAVITVVLLVRRSRRTG
jgi:hypothetical protein